jgi:hypothetical protein
VSDTEKDSISIADEAALKHAAFASITKVPTLMEWRIKAHSHWIFPADVGFGSLALIGWGIYLWIYFFMEESLTREFFVVSGTSFPLVGTLVWWGARKKTVWNYTISSEGGFVEFWEDYFQATKYFFKGLAVFAIVCVITMIAIAPGLIWAIAGIGGMVILAGIKLMTWENDVSWQRFKWDRPPCIFTDRKRGLVVLERHHNPDLPFWENYLYVQVFLPKDQIDDFLALCRKYAPGDVEYKEGHFRE